MEQVEVYLGPGRSLVVSYDPALVRRAIQELEAADTRWKAYRRSVAQDDEAIDYPDFELDLPSDVDRVKWQVPAYTLSDVNAVGHRLILVEGDPGWALVALDDSHDDPEEETLTDVDWGQGAAMLRDFYEKATRERGARPNRRRARSR